MEKYSTNMTHNRFHITLVVAAAATMALAACHRNAPVPTPEETDIVVQATETVEVDTVQQVLATVAETTPQAPAKVAAQSKPAAPKGKAETIYVETEGAQGRVWGHVTMRGDQGTGTIHDWDENTLSVRVRRHGDELYAIDQNSRQYVFRLKQNKTQE